MLPRKVNLEMVKGDTFAFPLHIKSYDEGDYIYLDSIDFNCVANYGGNSIFHKDLNDGIDRSVGEYIEAKGVYNQHIFGVQNAHYLVRYEFMLMDPVIGPLFPAVNTSSTYKIVNDVAIPDFPDNYTVLNEADLESYSAGTYFKWSGNSYSNNIDDAYENVFYIVEPLTGNTVEYLIKVSPEDTKYVVPGEYFHELRIGVHGDVFTLMQGLFTINPEVTRE